MSIYTADLPQVHPVAFLWALPAVPALAAAALTLAGGALARRGRARVAGALAVVATGAAVGLALAAALVVFADAPGIGRLLVEAHGLLVDEGAVQLGATAALDRVGAAAALGLAFVGCAAAVGVAARVNAKTTAPTRELAAICGGVAGGLAVVVADDLVLVLVGWELVTLATLMLVRRDGTRVVRGAEAAVASCAAQVAWLAGASLVFWGLGGDLGAGAHGRALVAVDVGGHEGAPIELKTLGDRSSVASVRQLTVGPTFSTREISDQLALHDGPDARPFAAALAARTLGPFPLALVATGLLSLGALGLALAGVLALERGVSGAAGAAVVIAGVFAGGTLMSRVPSVSGGGARWPLLAFPAALIFFAATDARLVRRALRELGSLPAADLSSGATWLDRRVVGPAARVFTLVAVAVAVVLLAP